LKRGSSQKAITGDIQVSQLTINRKLRRSRGKPGYLDDVNASNHNHLLVISVKRQASKTQKRCCYNVLFFETEAL
jgi:IS30 family transposase